MMNIKSLLVSHLFVALAFLAMGYWWGHSPDGAPVPEVRYLSSLDIDLPKFDSGIDLRHTIRYVFIPTGPDTVTRIDTVEVPASYPQYYWLTRPDPISQSGNTLQFRYYDPAEGAEVINEYTIRPRGIRFAVFADAMAPLDQFFGPIRELSPWVGLRGTAATGRFEFSIGSYFNPGQDDISAIGSVSYRIAGSN